MVHQPPGDHHLTYDMRKCELHFHTPDGAEDIPDGLPAHKVFMSFDNDQCLRIGATTADAGDLSARFLEFIRDIEKSSDTFIRGLVNPAHFEQQASDEEQSSDAK